MANDETLSGGKPDVRADLAQTTSQIRDSVNKEAGEARSALHDARDAAYEKANSLADEAKTIAADKAQTAQQSIAGSLQSFGEALRAAGEQLQDKDQAPAAKLINSAAGGIDSLASSLKDKPLQDVIGDVRKFGQSNPTVLIAGSVLAGLALGRLFKSSAPRSSGNYGSNNYGSLNMGTGASGRPSSQPRYPSSTGTVGGAASTDDVFSGDVAPTGFPEGGQVSPAGSTGRTGSTGTGSVTGTGAGAGSTSSAAFGSSGSDSPFEVDTKDTTSSTYSSTLGLGDKR
jgi:hypothetical protein